MNKNSKSEFNLITFFHGIMMGAADAVPGVSGGTIALILGIYSKFIVGKVTNLALSDKW